MLFTDGVSEAMDEDFDLFGEERLGTMITEGASLTVEALRGRILAGVRAHVGGADQHDDITLVLLKIGDVAAGGSPPAVTSH